MEKECFQYMELAENKDEMSFVIKRIKKGDGGFRKTNH